MAITPGSGVDAGDELSLDPSVGFAPPSII
jgi:hypothetical protein